MLGPAAQRRGERVPLSWPVAALSILAILLRPYGDACRERLRGITTLHYKHYCSKVSAWWRVLSGVKGAPACVVHLVFPPGKED